ncbi:hypothetical protein SAMN05444005_102325 [Flavobacterium urocaniciphilum]|uniref:Uncharacterized protein n=1 Tax=Flavobacterium urocaniciphilum TaxID=1299341 RepID=A0A1H9AT01_9FLAO|nr:hypothetical protein SAMN05444005_102325 [Flavobacterium urocaniciphilum]
MIFTFAILIFLLFLWIYCLLKNNNQIRSEHYKKISELKATIYSLHLKEKQLNEKVLISKNFDVTFKNDFKLIGAEIVSLQEFFLKLISEKK